METVSCIFIDERRGYKTERESRGTSKVEGGRNCAGAMFIYKVLKNQEKKQCNAFVIHSRVILSKILAK